MDVFFALAERCIRWARSNSVWPLSFGTSCCALEMIHAAASRTDLDKFGSLFRSSPKHADLMIVAGTVTKKMAPYLKTLYDQMLDPKYVIAMGSCAISGGIFHESDSVINGVGEIVRVDELVYGCPPTPEDLVSGILRLQAKIKRGMA